MISFIIENDGARKLVEIHENCITEIEMDSSQMFEDVDTYEEYQMLRI